MAEEYPSQLVPAGPGPLEPVAEAGPTTQANETPAQPAAEEQESLTREVLRNAIQKVMAEIEYHEKEAKKHIQQAADLRRELRDSLAFLQAQARKVEPIVREDSPPPKTFEPSAMKDRPAAIRRPRTGTKKKPASKKTGKH